MKLPGQPTVMPRLDTKTVLPMKASEVWSPGFSRQSVQKHRDVTNFRRLTQTRISCQLKPRLHTSEASHNAFNPATPFQKALAAVQHAALRLIVGAFSVLVCIGSPAVEPLIHAHAHNDYEHKRPLFDALDNGFCSVEADIYLVDGKLLVAHNFTQVKPERTLQALYLDPLRARIKENGGRVYAGGPQVTLLIDLKTKWQSIYPVLLSVLKDYSDIITTFTGDSVRSNALVVVITGDRSKEMFAGEQTRYAGFDGDLPELDSNDPPSLVPWVSSNWTKSFKWNGSGPMPEAESLKLAGMVDRAHKHGRRIRFWGAPDQPTFWREMLKHNVDLINTDDLPGLRKFLINEPAQ